MHNGIPHYGSRQHHDDRSSRHSDGRSEHDDRAFDGDRPGTSQRQRFTQADVDDRHDGWQRTQAREQGAREQGYSSSNQFSGQQGRDRGFDDRGIGGPRRGYGFDRDLDDRTSRGGFQLDGDLDSREIGGRAYRDSGSRESWGFTERDRTERDHSDHHGFDDRGIGAPQRSGQQSARDGRDVAGRSTFGMRDSRDVGSRASFRDARGDFGFDGRSTTEGRGWSEHRGYNDGHQGSSMMGSSTMGAHGSMGSLGMGTNGARYPAGPKGYTRSDDRIREDVCDRLAAMGDLDSSDIEVSVTAGEVTLAGTVPHRSMKYRAEQTCELVTGVKDIVNHVRVKDASRSSASSASSMSSMSSPSAGSSAVQAGAVDVKASNKGASASTGESKPDKSESDKHDDKTTRRS